MNDKPAKIPIFSFLLIVAHHDDSRDVERTEFPYQPAMQLDKLRTMKITCIALLLCLALVLPSAWAEKITLEIGKKTVHAEIADTPQSRERGLMRRDHLCADCGMLFVFEKAGRYNFWMKDTPLPLSIAFIAADGAIINIAEMRPDTTDIHGSEGNVLYALEMRSGWFARNGIKPGARVRRIKNIPVAH